MIIFYFVQLWNKLGDHKTATSGFTLGKAIACAVEFDDQHCGIYAGDADSYEDFAEVFDPIIQVLKKYFFKGILC